MTELTPGRVFIVKRILSVYIVGGGSVPRWVWPGACVVAVNVDDRTFGSNVTSWTLTTGEGTLCYVSWLNSSIAAGAVEHYLEPLS